MLSKKLKAVTISRFINTPVDKKAGICYHIYEVCSAHGPAQYLVQHMLKAVKQLGYGYDEPMCSTFPIKPWDGATVADSHKTYITAVNSNNLWNLSTEYGRRRNEVYNTMVENMRESHKGSI